MAVVLGMTACNETEKVEQKPYDFSELQRPEPNYCSGCGNSVLKADACNDGVCMEDPICPRDEGENLAEAHGIVFDLDPNEAYDIRDNFLINSLKGQDYISHYYELGGYLFDNSLIDGSNIGAFVIFGHEVYTQTNVLRNGAPSDIVVTTSFKASCMNYVNLIESSSPSILIQSRLDMIKADLNAFENKTKSDVLAQL